MERKFEAGDIVRIRQWDDMAAEFGLSRTVGSIPCCAGFPKQMKPLCGLRARVKKVSGWRVFLELLDEEPKEFRNVSYKCFVYSTDMIEPVGDTEPEETKPTTPAQEDISTLLKEIAELGGLF